MRDLLLFDLPRIVKRKKCKKDFDYKLDHIIEESRKVVKKKFPQRLDGETRDEYNQYILDETRLEVAYRLRVIADKLEKQANERKQY